jgi:hypothetical protein
MRKTATDRHLLAGVLDKQVLLYCAKYCCNISLCETWQGTCYSYMYRVLELTAVKDEVVFQHSESSNVLYKCFIHTGLWHNKNVEYFALYIYKYIIYIIYIYIYRHTHSYMAIYFPTRNLEVQCLRTSTRLYGVTFQQSLSCNAITCNRYYTVP